LAHLPYPKVTMFNRKDLQGYSQDGMQRVISS
jgi:hypothetical protein